jgi:hypothetical protein
MSSNSKPGRARARRFQLPRRSVPKGIALLEGVCSAGKRSKAIQRSEAGRQAIEDLQSATAAASKTLATKQSLAGQIPEASQIVAGSVDELETALRLYETTVAAVSRGNAAVMRAAGFEPQGRDPSRTFGAVTGVKGKPGVHAGEGIVGWPRVPFAVKYVLEVRFNLDSPAERWRAASTARPRLLLTDASIEVCARSASVAGPPSLLRRRAVRDIARP